MSKIFKLVPIRGFIPAFCLLILGACAAVIPKQAIRVAQPDNSPVRNFTSFSPSLRCMDNMLATAKRPRVLISSTGFPDLSKKVTVGADEMLVNAINQMNRQSGTYVFIDQSLEKDWGQIDLLTPQEENLRPRYYIRAAVTQVDKGVVSDNGALDLNLTNTPNPWNPFKISPQNAELSAGREVAVITVDMHLVSFPDKIIVPGSSVANSMVVVTNSRGAGVGGLIRLTGFDFSIKISRVESLGQAVRNLAELGVIELLGRHARVPYWNCLNIRPSNQKLDNLDEVRFNAMSRPSKISEAQKLLAFLGYWSGEPSGRLGQTTRKAISHFQADNKLIATGELNYQLFILLKERARGFSKNRNPFPSKPKPLLPPAISLTSDRATYRKGDVLQLQLSVQKDGFVTCFHQTGRGGIVQILPAIPGQRIQARGGTVLNIPDRNAKFDIKFEAKGTEEGVLCILDSVSKEKANPIALARGALKPENARSFQEIAEIYHRNRKEISTTEFRTRSR